MPQASPLMQLLQLMDNLYFVAFLVLVTIGIRVLWLRHRKPQFIGEPEQGVKSSSVNETKSSKASARPKDSVLEIIDMVLIALILVFGIVRPIFLQTFFIPSGSMEPTLLVKDKLIANKFIYDFRLPAHGEVIVFKPPIEAIVGNDIALEQTMWYNATSFTDLQKICPALADERKAGAIQTKPLPTNRDDFIKRVIGVPGDHIRIVANEGVYVNGKLLNEPYTSEKHSASAMSFPTVVPDPGPAPRIDQYVDTRADETTQSLQVQKFQVALAAWIKSWYEYTYMYKARIAPHVVNGEFVVPKGSVFVMGDNRSPGGSFDSRYWGVVSLNDIRGRAVSTFWPLNRLKLI
ncbi:MAG TPA: signal peptidase I [Armatimonadota bacterium]|nr:signal peptidase I [Armatimonadota bacterium]